MLDGGVEGVAESETDGLVDTLGLTDGLVDVLADGEADGLADVSVLGEGEVDKVAEGLGLVDVLGDGLVEDDGVGEDVEVSLASSQPEAWGLSGCARDPLWDSSIPLGLPVLCWLRRRSPCVYPSHPSVLSERSG